MDEQQCLNQDYPNLQTCCLQKLINPYDSNKCNRMIHTPSAAHNQFLSYFVRDLHWILKQGEFSVFCVQITPSPDGLSCVVEELFFFGVFALVYNDNDSQKSVNMQFQGANEKTLCLNQCHNCFAAIPE